MSSPLASLLPALCSHWAAAFSSRGLPLPVAAELIAQGEALVPSIAMAPGQHRAIALDARGGCAYVRRTGSIALAIPDNNTCDRKRLSARMPLRVVVVADTETLTCRDQEVALSLADLLLGALLTGGLPIASLGLSSAKITPERVLTDAATILKEELGMDTPLPARRGLVAAELELEVAFDPACLPTCPPTEIPT